MLGAWIKLREFPRAEKVVLENDKFAGYGVYDVAYAPPHEHFNNAPNAKIFLHNEKERYTSPPRHGLWQCVKIRTLDTEDFRHCCDSA